LAARAPIARDLAKLEALRWVFGTDAAQARRLALRRLLRARIASAPQLERLHELLLAARAYPDDPATLALASRALRGFGSRADVRRLRETLADTGIAGCDVRFPFFAPTARRLAARWPLRLELDWEEIGSGEVLEAWLPLLSHDGEVRGQFE